MKKYDRKIMIGKVKVALTALILISALTLSIKFKSSESLRWEIERILWMGGISVMFEPITADMIFMHDGESGIQYYTHQFSILYKIKNTEYKTLLSRESFDSLTIPVHWMSSSFRWDENEDRAIYAICQYLKKSKGEEVTSFFVQSKPREKIDSDYGLNQWHRCSI